MNKFPTSITRCKKIHYRATVSGIALLNGRGIVHISSILGISAFLCGMVIDSTAQAACVATLGSNYSCSGTTNATQSIGAPGANVVTMDGFSVSTSNGPGIIVTGNGALSYNDQYSSSISTISGTALSLKSGTPTNPATIQGGAGVTIFTNGAITAGGTGDGIEAVNGRTGAVTINAKGTSSGATGVKASNYGGTDVILDVGAVTGRTANGITVLNNGTGKTTISASGKVESLATSGSGISVSNSTTTLGGISINVADVSGSLGIWSTNQGAGKNEVIVTGNVTATGAGGRGISVDSTNGNAATDGTGIVINVGGNIDAVSEAIYAYYNGKGAGSSGISIVTNGTVGGTGIWAVADVAAIGNVGIQTLGSVISTGGTGITARHRGMGDAIVIAGDVTGTSRGIEATAKNGNTSVTATGSVTAKSGTGIYASANGNVRVNAGGAVEAASGIRSTNRGAGKNEVVVSGNVVATGGRGLFVESTNGNAATDGTGIAIKVGGTINATEEAIYASNNGKGASSSGVEITTTGTVTSTGGDGIRAENQTAAVGDITVQSNASVTALQSGVTAQNLGSGNTIVTANDVTSTTSNGINAYSENGNTVVTVNGTVSAVTSGIAAQTNQKTGGDVIVNAEGPISVSSATSAGILALGKGNVTVKANGRVKGDTGVWATSEDGDITIRSNAGLQGNTGLVAFGNKNVTVNTSGEMLAEQYGIGIAAGSSFQGDWWSLTKPGQGAGPSLKDLPGSVVVAAEGNITAKGASSSSLLAPVSAILVQTTGNAADTAITTGGTVSGTDTGIFVGSLERLLAGVTEINVKAGSVVQGGQEGIRLFSSTAQSANIINAGTIQNSSGKSTSLAIATPASFTADSVFHNAYSTSIANRGRVQGTVNLAGSGNSFSNQSGGVWNTAGGTNWLTGDLVSGGDGEIMNAGTIIAAEPDATNAVTTIFNGVGANSFDNAGLVTMQNKLAGDTTVINGHYDGQGGTVAIDTVLGGDSSATDRLIVNGDTSGTSQVTVYNARGGGAPTVEGIRIIEVSGASNGTFSLLSDYKTKDGQNAVVGGAYAYTLHKNGIAAPADGDWYLRSQIVRVDPEVPPVDPGTVVPITPPKPRYQAGASVYEAYPQALLGLNGVSTLQQRLGNRMWAEAGNRIVAQGADPVGTPYASAEEAGVAVEGNGVWGRIEGGYNRMNGGLSTTDVDYRQDVFKMQAGIDGQLMENAGGTLIGGVAVHYVRGTTKTASAYDAFNGGGEISTDGYGFGGTLTWYGQNGLYLDTQGQVTWYRSDLSYDGGNAGLGDGRKGFGYTLSVEGGQRIAIDPQWSVTPQAQLINSRVTFDNFTDAFGSFVSLGKGDSLQGRLGITLDHQTSWQNANGLMDRAHVYGIANLYYEFLEGTRVSVDDISFANRKDRVWGGVGVGGSYNWDDDKYSIYGEGVVNTSLNKVGDSYSLKGNVGFRVKW